MIDDSMLRSLPAYTPSRVVPIRNGENQKFYDHLLSEAGLSELRPYIIDMKRLYQSKNGAYSELVRFVKYRGTVAAVELALGWIGLEKATFIRLSNTEYEIDPGREPTVPEVKAIQIACRLAAPARGQLKRIFHKDFEVKIG